MPALDFGEVEEKCGLKGEKKPLIRESPVIFGITIIRFQLFSVILSRVRMLVFPLLL